MECENTTIPSVTHTNLQECSQVASWETLCQTVQWTSVITAHITEAFAQLRHWVSLLPWNKLSTVFQFIFHSFTTTGGRLTSHKYERCFKNTSNMWKPTVGDFKLTSWAIRVAVHFPVLSRLFIGQAVDEDKEQQTINTNSGWGIGWLLSYGSVTNYKKVDNST